MNGLNSCHSYLFNSLIHISDKYAFEQVFHLLSGRLASMRSTHPKQVLEHALRHRQPSLARDALYYLGTTRISSLSPQLLESLPTRVVIRLFTLQETARAINTASTSWSTQSAYFVCLVKRLSGSAAVTCEPSA